MFIKRKLQYLAVLYVFVELFFLFTAVHLSAQEFTPNKYGLKVIDKVEIYRQTVAKDTAKQLINLSAITTNIVLDLRYSTKNNFTHKKLYSKASTTYLRLPAANALQQVQKELNEKGLGIKIWDAYRPYAATELMWELVKDERYTANPAKGSGHNRGLAVDLTLIDLKTGIELKMGTGFDNFSDTAHHDFVQLPAEVLKNRLLLKTTMEKYGFKALDTEWWHYYWINDRDYEILNLSFKQLKKIK
jgi:zinc D-Ala-D-Ala dipeptidase